VPDDPVLVGIGVGILLERAGDRRQVGAGPSSAMSSWVKRIEPVCSGIVPQASVVTSIV
jgi:hypothetical protein